MSWLSCQWENTSWSIPLLRQWVKKACQDVVANRICRRRRKGADRRPMSMLDQPADNVDPTVHLPKCPERVFELQAEDMLEGIKEDNPDAPNRRGIGRIGSEMPGGACIHPHRT